MGGAVIERLPPLAPVTFGEHVRHYRQNLDITMGDLARHLGLSVVALSDVERGRATLIPETVAKIAAYLGVEPEPLEALAKVARETWTPPAPPAPGACGSLRERKRGS